MLYNNRQNNTCQYFMKNNINYLKAFIIIIAIITISSKEYDFYILKRMPLKKQYSALSCKIDSLYYALQYYVPDLESIEWFVNKIPVKPDKYLKKNKDGTYSIIDPLKYMPGSFYGQQARFTFQKELKILYNNKLKDVYFDKDNYLDVKKNYDNYQRIISFGIDNELLVETFKDYFKEKNIKVKYFFLKSPTVESVSKVFIDEIKSNRVIICNGTTHGFKNPRAFAFKILDSGNIYKWKEASHSYVLIGYDIAKRYFVAADNYGDIDTPYNPKFRFISFEELFNEITMLDMYTLDKSFSIGTE